MKKIYFIDQEKFVQDTISSLCKRAEIECYSTDNGENSLYIISDFAPSVLVVSQSAVESHKDEFLKTMLDDSVSQIPVIVILNEGEQLDKDLEKRSSKVLTRPIVISTFLKDIGIE